MINILIVDDHPSLMEGTKVLLEQEADMKVDIAQNSDTALIMTGKKHFDVALIDLYMPGINGIELTRKVLVKDPNVTILIYTGFEFKNHYNVMIESGVSGFILKTANREQLVTSIRCAMRGESILPISLLKQLRRVKGPMENGHEMQAIMDNEHQILNLIAKGMSNKEIAEALLISKRSLEYSLTALFQKLNVKSRFDAVIKANQLNLLSDLENANNS